MSGVALGLTTTAIVLAALFVLARATGMKAGTDVVVRCDRGHLFTTIWIPGASIKAVRFGWVRFQRCPVGQHWAFVRQVPEDELSPDQVAFAHQHHDSSIP